MSKLKSSNTYFIIAFVAILLGLLGYYFYATHATPSTPVEVNVSLDDNIKGNKTAPVTLVEFGDFQCPACGAYEPIVKKVVAENSKDVRFVFRHFPLTQIHPNALLAAKYAEAAGIQGKFWEMHDILYEKQSEWSGALNAKSMFDDYAKTIGLDVAKLSQDASAKSVEDKIRAQYTEGVKLGVQGTPTFFINGKKLDRNPGSAEELTALIKAAATK
jgi:protein-disulfide isomerase